MINNKHAKYDRIGLGYNTTRKPDPYLVQRMLHHLQPSKKGLYLDIGCGTGNYTHEFQSSGFSFVGIDPSQTMLDVANQGSSSAEFVLGNSEQVDFPKEHFSGITASLTIHHWKDLEKGFAELYRVLKSKGRLIVFTSTPKQMRGYWLNHYFPKMLHDSIIQMPSLDRVLSALVSAGFETVKTEPYKIQPDLQDKFLYCGKEHPKLYFDENIRKGISSFSDLSNQEEVTEGLEQLKADMKSTKIIQIMEDYKNELGDYLYVIAEK